jgi:pilus assembly protein TadC
MATKSENVEIAVLQEQMETVKDVLKQVSSDTKSIRVSVDNLPTIYATKADLTDHAKTVKDDLTAHRKSQLAQAITSVLITAIITALVYYFITHTVTG